MVGDAAEPALCTSTSEPIKRPQVIAKQKSEPILAQRPGEEPRNAGALEFILTPCEPVSFKTIRRWIVVR